VAPPYQKKLAITSPTSGDRSVGIVRLRTQTMDFFYDKLKKYRSNFHSNNINREKNILLKEKTLPVDMKPLSIVSKTGNFLFHSRLQWP
jgi:hypothetical protein